MKYQIGQVLEDGYIYAGEMRNHETGEVYGLAIAPKDKPKEITWNEAIKLPIQNSKEGNLISANLGHLFGDEWYWSSTEYASGYSWVQRFNDGSQSGGSKSNGYRVRCVRRLNLSSFDSLPAKNDSQVLKELKKQTALLEKIAGVLK